MENISLSLVVVRASDVLAALEFYRLLGLDFVQEQHGSGPIHHSCELGGIVMEIYPQKSSAPSASAPSAEQTTMLGLGVASLDEALSRLEAVGVKPKLAPQDADWGRWSDVTDPDGRTIQLSEAPKQANMGF